MDENLLQAIHNSGHNLHLKAVEIIKGVTDNNWNVKISPYFCDEITDKPREIDIIATREIHDPKFDIHLFIECKHFKEQIAFRNFPIIEKETEEAILVNGIDKKKLNWNNPFNGKRHHFIVNGKIGRLYDTKSEKDMVDAITQPIKSFIFFRKTFSKPYIAYLITVFEGINGIYQIEENNILNPDSWPCEKRATIFVNYSYKTLNVPVSIFRNENFIIDFIHVDEFKDFIEKTIIPEAVKIRDV